MSATDGAGATPEATTPEAAAPEAAAHPQLLAGKVVVVSGVGPGLGRSIAVRSALAGADVVLAARTEARLVEVAKEVTDLGRRAITVTTDIRDDAAGAALLQASLDAFGRVDALVNNAFKMPPMTGLADVDPAAISKSIDTTVLGTLRLTRTFVPALEASEGAVVVVNSAVIRHSRLTYGPYKVSKAALLALAQSLASELGPRGIRVNSVAPGWIWGESLQWWFGHLAQERGVDRKVVYDETAATTDLRRLPEPDRIADTVAFLASDLARDVTGQCLDVNCGEFHH